MTRVDANKRRRKSRRDMSEIILGVGLGTTNSAVGAVDSGFPILLANEDGRRITPSAMWMTSIPQLDDHLDSFPATPSLVICGTCV